VIVILGQQKQVENMHGYVLWLNTSK